MFFACLCSCVSDSVRCNQSKCFVGSKILIKHWFPPMFNTNNIRLIIIKLIILLIVCITFIRLDPVFTDSKESFDDSAEFYFNDVIAQINKIQEEKGRPAAKDIGHFSQTICLEKISKTKQKSFIVWIHINYSWWQ